MVLIVAPLIVLGAIGSLAYGAYRAANKWRSAFWCFLAAAVSFLGCSGVLAENLWGPQWAWNLGRHSREYAEQALVQGILFLFLGFYFRATRQRNAS